MKNEIKNLKKAASRISKAIKKKENIILYGDADLDGVCSVIITKEAINTLGGKASAIYFPDRELEGYGLTKTALARLKRYSPALLIVLDLGIGNFNEVKLAQKLGLEVIIVDHHEILGKLPEAKIIVNPKQKGDSGVSKILAATGLAFKLAEAVLKDNFSEILRKSFLELTALATIADMMPREGDNIDFIEEGSSYLENSWRPGIKAFFEYGFFSDYALEQKIYKINSILNIRDIKEGFPVAFRLLTSSSIEDSKSLIEILIEKNKEKREKINQIINEVEEKLVYKDEPIIFEGSHDWEVNLISAAASYFCQKYEKPSFIYKKMAEESQGTVRNPSGTNSVEMMKKCKKYLITFGGHPLASGFRAKNENLDKFKACLIKNIKDK